MSEVFSAGYSAAYDAIYSEKDYPAECDLIESLFGRYAAVPVRNVLDLGCGTGNHSLVLARRGYQVVGVDRSQAMLALARAKRSEDLAGRAQFVAGDLRQLELGQRFEAALMMFAVLGYQCSDADVAASLAAARRHLVQGGLLAFDVWYGPAVLGAGPAERVRRIVTAQGPLLRRASGELERERRVCRVLLELLDAEAAQATTTREIHEIRYFFAEELLRFLAQAGFTPARLGGFPAFDREPDATTWSVLVAARAL